MTLRIEITMDDCSPEEIALILRQYSEAVRDTNNIKEWKRILHDMSGKVVGQAAVIRGIRIE